MTTIEVEDLPKSCKDEVAQQFQKMYHEPQNFFLLDLDEKDPQRRYDNMRRSIANHRFWTLWNSKKIFKYDAPPVLTSWQTPERGHYLQGIKVQGEILCFVGNASASWMYGVMSKDYVGEFLEEEATEGSLNGRDKKQKQMKNMPSKQKKKVTVETIKKHNIHAQGWTRKYFPISANYGKLDSVDLGPIALENSCLNFLKFLKGNLEPTSSELHKWATAVIVQCWDTSRNDEVMDSVLQAYHPSTFYKCSLRRNSEREMHDWKKISIETDECITNRRNFKKVGLSRPTTVRQVFGLIRQLYGQIQDYSPFDANRDLPNLDPNDHDDEASDEDNEQGGQEGNDNEVKKLHFPDWIVTPQFQNVPFGNDHNNDGPNNGGGANEDNVMVVSRWTGIPVNTLDQDKKEKLVHLTDRLQEQAAGQEEAVKLVAQAVLRSMGSFPFLGSTDVGKIERAKALVEKLFDSEKLLIWFDMAEFVGNYSVLHLIGAPASCHGNEDGGQLTEAVRQRLYRDIIFDEIEKADPAVFIVFIQLIHGGALTDRKGCQFPDNSIDFMDKACSITRMQTDNELKGNNMRCAPENVVREAIVCPDQVAQAVYQWTGIPVNTLDQDVKGKLVHLQERAADQEEAVKLVAQAVLRSRPGQIMESFFFLGSTGIGKTKLAKALVVKIFDSEKLLIWFAMTKLVGSHSVLHLIGAPASCLDHEDGGQLTEAVRPGLYRDILCDEIEKADPDGDVCIDGNGKTANFKNTIFIMTSYLGAEYLMEAMAGEKSMEAAHNLVIKQAQKLSKPELLNRLSEVVVLEPPPQGKPREVANVEMKGIIARLPDKNINLLSANDDALDVLSESHKPLYGARPMKP